jgi:hypothetical protein
MVHIGDGRRRSRTACWDKNTETIKLPVRMRIRWIVLHEVAHSLAPEDARHGPDFVRIYIDLLARYADVPASVSRALAKKMRVKVGKSSVLAKPLARATIKRLAQIEVERKKLQADIHRLRDKLYALDNEASILRRSRRKATVAA